MNPDYCKRIKHCFSVAYKALEKHDGAGAEDFKAIHGEFVELSRGDDLLMDLLVAVYGELAREHRKRSGGD